MKGIMPVTVPQDWVNELADRDPFQSMSIMAARIRNAPVMFCLWQLAMGQNPNIGWAYGWHS